MRCVWCSGTLCRNKQRRMHYFMFQAHLDQSHAIIDARIVRSRSDIEVYHVISVT